MNEKDTKLQVRVNARKKAQAQKVLKSYGLSMSTAVDLLLHRIVEDKALPFEIKIPNAETRVAINESRKTMAQRQPHPDE
ncbi:type II toxin-antitoxin system RelB/DinJ family antitoxin [Duganella radicis]|uniref:Type II toxin-antitoxin system RelB/DinJ family antitoxin n=1 Tax=Duganella radicis TaxID=551988 RepID=A0A6L6PIW2_9BURK|nr:type II toxin-antitoxin system RelB/DinJ family antitoxin [Duganella radicis]MTV38980.1 type II toxin-antitoxin system RelB/DinJ family antitoxin [Duganella radicis]